MLLRRTVALVLSLVILCAFVWTLFAMAPRTLFRVTPQAFSSMELTLAGIGISCSVFILLIWAQYRSRRPWEPRGASSRALGLLLRVVSWAGVALILGVTVPSFVIDYVIPVWISGDGASAWFDVSYAAVPAGVYLFILTGRLGGQLIGCRVTWGFLRGRRLVRTINGQLATAIVFGFSPLLAFIGEILVLEIIFGLPVAAFHWLQGTLGTNWLAVPVTVIFCIVWLCILLVINKLLRKVAGEINATTKRLLRTYLDTLPDVRAIESTQSRNYTTRYGGGTELKRTRGTAFTIPILPGLFSFTYSRTASESHSSSYQSGVLGANELDALGGFQGMWLSQHLGYGPPAYGHQSTTSYVSHVEPPPPDLTAYLPYETPADLDHMRKEIEKTAVSALTDASDADLHVVYRALVGYDELRIRRDGGEPVRETGDLKKLRDLTRAYRSACYAAGRGTWFTLSFVVTRDNGRRALRDLRRGFAEPDWEHSPHPSEYVDDLRRFPIHPSLIPAWLRRHLRMEEISLRDLWRVN